MTGSIQPELVTLLLSAPPVVAKEGRLRAGRAEGVWKGYAEDGSLSVQGSYVRGIRHGRWVRWAREGQKAVQVEYRRGKLHAVEAWYDDGTPAIRAGFENGELAPGWQAWRRDGVPASRMGGVAGLQSMRFVTNLPADERTLPEVGSAR